MSKGVRVQDVEDILSRGGEPGCGRGFEGCDGVGGGEPGCSGGLERGDGEGGREAGCGRGLARCDGEGSGEPEGEPDMMVAGQTAECSVRDVSNLRPS